MPMNLATATKIAAGLAVIALAVAAEAQSLKDKLTANENKIYQAVENHDAKTFGSMLTDDSVLVSGSQVLTKDQVIQSVVDPKNGSVANASLTNFQLFTPKPDTAILTFTNDRDDVDPSGKHSKSRVRETTVWVKNNGKWLSAFHEIGLPLDEHQ